MNLALKRSQYGYARVAGTALVFAANFTFAHVATGQYSLTPVDQSIFNNLDANGEPLIFVNLTPSGNGIPLIWAWDLAGAAGAKFINVLTFNSTTDAASDESFDITVDTLGNTAPTTSVPGVG